MTTGNSVFELKKGSGWSRGLDNMLGAELGQWFRTRRWWVQILVWAAILNLILLAVALSEDGDSAELVVLYNVFLGIFGSIGVCILMQGSIVKEKQSGTAAWVLSKPVSRLAFVVAKLVANVIGVTVTILLAQGLIAYLIIYFDSGTALPLWPFVGGLGVQLVHLLFYLTGTLMLGAVFNKRGPVIAIPLVILFAQELLSGIFPDLGKVLPYMLALPLDNSQFPSVAVAVMTGSQPLSYLPLATTLGASVLFVALGLWVFQRLEL
jgi:ABC-2 type transport system permease protein